MKIIKSALAGTLESSDILVEVSPTKNGIEVELESVVYNQFADSIIETVRDMFHKMDVDAAHVKLNDHGALECVIRARVETAIRRAGGDDK